MGDTGTDKRPRVSVLMTAFQAEGTIAAAIESALTGQLAELEVVVVDDGSEDGTAAVVEGFRDPRIRLVRNAANRGIPASRQRGAEEARGEYLAILDSDDIAHPERFARQADFLDARPDCGVVGTWARILTPDGELRVRRRPTGSDVLRARLLFNNPVKDCSAMARTALVQQYGFREEFPVCELVDLWQRMLLDGHAVANLPEVLVTYRDHPGGISKRRQDLIRELRIRLVAEQLDRLGVACSVDDLASHYELCKTRGRRPSLEKVQWAEGWLERLREANGRVGLYPEPAFTRALGERWWRVCSRSRMGGVSRFGRLVASPLAGPALRDRLDGVLLRGEGG